MGDLRAAHEHGTRTCGDSPAASHACADRSRTDGFQVTCWHALHANAKPYAGAVGGTCMARGRDEGGIGTSSPVLDAGIGLYAAGAPVLCNRRTRALTHIPGVYRRRQRCSAH